MLNHATLVISRSGANIVSEIKASIDAQREIEKQIQEKQQEISKIIIDAIKS